MTRFTVVVMALFCATLSFAQTTRPKHHTIFQMNDPEAEWGHLITHVTNLQIAFEKDGGVEVEVVFYGPGIEMLRKTNANYAAGLKRLADSGVVLAACQNSLRDRKIKMEELFPFATSVDSAVAEITRKQEAGWAYIK